MRVYHFCCERDMRGIRNKGITQGAVVCEKKIPQGKGKPAVWQPCMRTGWQWVTLDGRHDRQSWATQYTIRIDRTEYRWTVDIPEKEEDSLYNRHRLNELLPGSGKLFDGWDGSENWLVYRGSIPKKWLTKLERWNKKTECWEDV